MLLDIARHASERGPGVDHDRSVASRPSFNTHDRDTDIAPRPTVPNILAGKKRRGTFHEISVVEVTSLNKPK
jgi:hypothetical protein